MKVVCCNMIHLCVDNVVKIKHISKLKTVSLLVNSSFFTVPNALDSQMIPHPQTKSAHSLCRKT